MTLYAENFIDSQDIYKQYKKSKDPEKFLRSHETEIIIHETARDQLKAMGYDKVPHPKKLEKEMAENVKALATLNSSYSSEKAEVAQLNSVKKNIDKFMENDISRVKANTKKSWIKCPALSYVLAAYSELYIFLECGSHFENFIDCLVH